MHELSIMDSALSMVLEQAKAAGAKRIHVVRLRVGALSGAMPEALQMAFEALTPGTEAEEATLEIEEVPATFRCGKCNEDFTSDEMLAECPNCGALSRDIVTGRELELTSLEVD
jgi:hydrogenase nickel incorporation protein HypA/HybF